MPQVNRKSLQIQYMLFSGILVVFIVIGILYSRSVVTEQYLSLSAQRNQASSILVKTAELRDHINTITSSIDVVMLEPEFQQQISLVFTASFNEINFIINEIKKNKLILRLNENAQLDALLLNVRLLRQYALELFDIRSDINKQYPSMAVSAAIILPARDAINDIFSISINEAEEEGLNQSNIDAYESLIKSRLMWGNVVSAYRLYLANKFGAINDEDLTHQEGNVDILLENMKLLASALVKKANNNKFGFESTEQLNFLIKQLANWEDGFTKVKVIHNSDAWRADSKFMRNTILPLVNEVGNNLKALDKIVHKKNTEYAKGNARVSEQQSFYLIVITLIFVAYSIIVFMFLKKLVFNPLAKFSNSIRAQVFSLDEKELMSLANTKETFVLIDSFIEMHHQSVAHRDELSYQAMHDSLTGLPNRKALMMSLEENIKVANRDNKHLTFFMLDLNKFKDVNDTLGHHIGDELLIMVGKRLKEQLREVDLVARLGGDEFSVVLPNTDKKDAILVANKINRALEHDFLVGKYTLNVGASIGITEYPSDGSTSNILMQHADVAMYECKHHKTDYSFYDLEKDVHSLESLALTQDLKIAIRKNTLSVFYQPKLAAMDQKPIGSEALLRWEHPDIGFIAPEHIIELAEGSGMIDELTILIINQALIDQKKLEQLGFSLKIAINLSVHNLKNESFVCDVENVIQHHKVDARVITFEITESAMMADPERSINMMRRLTRLGVNFSVDDFGTGFSSLSYLKKLPVSELKIDRSFVCDIATDQSDKVIVQSTIDLAHNLGLSVVAEGVEDEESLLILQQLGCDMTQGYFFSKPLPFDQFKSWLETHA